MRIGILGPLEVMGRDGVPRDPAAQRQRRLLLALLVWRNEPVSVDRLVDVVWVGSPLPQDPTGTLRTYVTRLRAVLEPEPVGGRPRVLAGGRDRYTLLLDGIELDASAFEEDLARGIEAVEDDPAAALHHLDRALMRWRGPALMEVADEHWAQPEAVRLEELRLNAAEHRLACLIATDRQEEAVGALERHVREHPLRERPHGLLMVALDRTGRTADAAEVFRAFRQRLADETGLYPSADLQRLHERLLVNSSSTVFAAMPAAGVWNQLPVSANRLIGRDGAVAEVVELLGSNRVVTLTGAGGVGKTRLALEVARVQRDAGGHVAVVELGRVSAGEDVVDSVFAALHLPAAVRTDAVEGLVRILRARDATVVLDDCEHLLGAVASLIDRLTRDCPYLRVLATSREPIGTDGERVYRLPSLDVPDGVALFRERAAAGAPAEQLGPDDDARIALICRRLDGIPLAIELAAVRTTHLTVAEIADRLDERFWLLAGGRRSLPRHQTLSATVDWSYDLLDDEERLLLRAASVFVDGFDAAALAAVAGTSDHTTVDLLASLVKKSLVEAGVGTGPCGRYRLLETIRLYGLERLRELGELADLRQRHAGHFLARATTHGPRLGDLPPGGSEHTMCRIRLEPVASRGELDLANNLQALDWLDRRGNLVGLGRLAARLATVLGYRGFLDPARRYLGRADVADAMSDADERALYLTASALHAPYFANWGEELRFGRAAMACAKDPAMRAIATTLTTQASLVFDLDRIPELVEAAQRELPPDAHHARLLLRGQETLRLVLKGRLTQALDRLDVHARAGDVFAAGEQRLLLHVLGDDERLLAVEVPRRAQPDHVALWAYRWPLSEALACAARGDHAEAWRLLAQAGDHIASCPVALLDRDVLVACAAAAFHRGDAAHAFQLVTAAGRRSPSPAAHVLREHYTTLSAAQLDPDRRAAIIEVASDLRPGDALDQELHRLRAVPTRDGHTSARAPSR